MAARDTHRLDRPIDSAVDHALGSPEAPITVVEYGSYGCPNCRAANERIAEIRDRFGDRLRYVFRHKPLPGSDLAMRAAELVERAPTSEQFWKAHVTLMLRSPSLAEDDLEVVAQDLGVSLDGPATEAEQAARRVASDVQSARASGVAVTPTFFINGRRYDGPWDDASFGDAIMGSLGHRMRVAALEFADWTPSIGVLLLITTVTAIVLTNSALGPAFAGFWQQTIGLIWGAAGFELPLLSWVNDGLLSIFFLVVGLEIKREFTIGHLSSRRLAALPVAAALGGMVLPALLYSQVVPAGPWSTGWGVPMATDTAFAVALIAVMGRRVPIELRIFFTAAAIIDDIGAIAVVAVFYSETLHFEYLLAGLAICGLLVLLNKSGIYRVTPYALLGVALWFCVHQGGIHATLAAVILALVIPTRPPANLGALHAQADAVFSAEANVESTGLGHRLSAPALRALDAIHDRLESPAARVLRHVEPRSNYLVLPLFALANAGVVLSADVVRGHGLLLAAIVGALVVGKPVGILLAAWLAARLGLAEKPDAYSWLQVGGVGALGGIGFTMSLFIAGQAFPGAADFAAAKIAVFAASLVSSTAGVAILWFIDRRQHGPSPSLR